MYSVTSAYDVLRKKCDGNSNKVLDLIWLLKIPPKVRLFLWRPVMNILPICDNLNKEQVMIDNTCPICRGNAELVFHLFVDCYFANNCCYSSPVGYYHGTNDNFKDWLCSMLNK